MSKTQTPRRIALISTLLLAVAAATLAPAGVFADAFLSQSYTTSSALPLDTLVSLKTNSANEVVAANADNADNLLGVVVNADNTSLSLMSGNENEVQVASTGTLQILVSDLNGVVQKGDYITASPLEGVGMRATTNVRTIGIAQSTMTGGTQQPYKDSTGKSQTVTIGEVPVLVSVSSYFKQPDKTLIPASVQNVVNAFAGRSVDTLPILISAGIFVVTLLVVIIIIYSMIRNGIISVGRNPLSQAAVYRNLIQMSGLVLGILAASFIAIYMVLTKL